MQRGQKQTRTTYRGHVLGQCRFCDSPAIDERSTLCKGHVDEKRRALQKARYWAKRWTGFNDMHAMVEWLREFSRRDNGTYEFSTRTVKEGKALIQIWNDGKKRQVNVKFATTQGRT
jgi:hypothetical protein